MLYNTPSDYSALMAELRAFCSDSASNTISKDQKQNDFLKQISQKPVEIYKEHPDWDAMQVKEAAFRWLGENFRPVLFRELPFYFEAGVNGGWWNSPMKQGMEEAFYPRISKNLPPAFPRHSARVANNYTVCCGLFIDAYHHVPPFTKILKSGFRGVWEETRQARAQCQTAAEAHFADAALAGLEAIHAIQLKYADEAKNILEHSALTPSQRENMERIREAAARCPWEPPQNFYEGLNTLMFLREILALADGLFTYTIGHPDAMLKELYDRDIRQGTLSEDEAYHLLACYLINYHCHYDSMKTVESRSDHEMEVPVTIGGCDENGDEVFNDITRMILDAHRRYGLVYPKVHCRVSPRSSSEYLGFLAEDVYRGRCVHSLFNDDANIASMLKFGKTLEEARRYLCGGCWDGCVDSVENMDTANYFNLAKILESMIYQDAPPELEFHFVSLEGCRSFEELRDKVYRNTLDFMRTIMTDYGNHGLLYSQINPHPLFSSCLDGCLASRKDESIGGAKYKERAFVIAFLANLVDSLCAIKTLCYDKKTCSVGELLQAVRRNWEGADFLRSQVLKCPCWGDDSRESMEMAKFFLDGFLRDTKDLKNEKGGPYVFSIWGYREFRYWGETTRALPDGRRSGEELAQALNPSHFRSSGEITTTLNALSRIDHTDLLSSNINLTFDRHHVTPALLESIFRTFLYKKMQLLQPNCFSREDILDAQKHPENYHHLIVKVCGFSARFVALEKAWQDIIIARKMF